MLTGGVAAVAQYFKRHIYKAQSISFVGGGVGALIYAPLLEWLNSIYGWRGSALLFAGITMNVFVFAMVVYPPKSENNTKLNTVDSHCVETAESNPEKKEVELEYIKETSPCINGKDRNGETEDGEYPMKEIKENNEINSTQSKTANEFLDDKLLTARERFTDVNFWCLGFIGFAWSFSNTTFISVFKDLCETNGVLHYFQTAMIYCGITQVLSRILVGFLTFDKVIVSFALTFLTGSGVIGSFLFATSYWPLIISSTGLGMILGSTFLMVPMSVGAVYGRKEMAITYGYVLLCIASSSAIGPPIIGKIYIFTSFSFYSFANKSPNCL